MGEWKGPPHEQIPKCGAKTRAGHPCKRFSMANGRCEFHGGKSTGARNPHYHLKHGRYTKESMEERRIMAVLLHDAKELMKEIT